jgi:hypothetical protein
VSTCVKYIGRCRHKIEPLLVNWHLCSDYKLVVPFVWFGGAGCNKLCNWDYSAPREDATLHCYTAHSVEVIQQKSEWAQELFRPLHEAQAKLKPSQSLQSRWYSWLKRAAWEFILLIRLSLIEQPRSASRLSNLWASSCRIILTMLWFSTCAMLKACSNVQRVCQRITCVLLRLSLKVSMVICRPLMTVWCVLRASCNERQPACINWRRKSPNSIDAEEELEKLVERIDLAQEAVDTAEEIMTWREGCLGCCG